MHEILKHIPTGGYVLDLGSSIGSFDTSSCDSIIVRVDLRFLSNGQPDNFVQADAAALPFFPGTFNLVVCNHSLEHFHDLKPALREIGRVLKKSGSLFVSVPDGGALTDRIYRWLGRGGDHVNCFHSPESAAELITRNSGLQHIASRTLFTSFSFLNRKNLRARPPRKLALFLGGWEPGLVLLNAVLRWLDRAFGTRTSVYGWALYFGAVPEPISTHPWINVCVRCGQGHDPEWLKKIDVVRRAWLFQTYLCPNCGARNIFHRDEDYRVFADSAPMGGSGSTNTVE